MTNAIDDVPYVDYTLIKRHVGHNVICTVEGHVAAIKCLTCNPVEILGRGDLHIELSVAHSEELREQEARCPRCQHWILGRYWHFYCTWCGHFVGPKAGARLCRNSHPMMTIERFCAICGMEGK
jgi:hypothetical protein